MGLYYTNELAFELPQLPFVDETVTMLHAKTEGGRNITMILQRFPMPADRSVRDIAQDHVTQAQRTLPAYALLEERPIELAGREGLEITVRWRGEKSMIYTRQAFFTLPGLWLLLAGNADMIDRAYCDQTFEHMVRTMRLRE